MAVAGVGVVDGGQARKADKTAAVLVRSVKTACAPASSRALAG
jgi:hypothetical protein